MGDRPDPYHPPTAQTLFAALPDELRAVAVATPKRLGCKAAPVRITPWGWVLRLADPGGAVYLFPRAGRLVIAARLPRGMFEAESDKTTKALLTMASCVNDGIWAEWAVASQDGFDAVHALISRR